MTYQVKTVSDNIKKAIIFAGDQFTYGQGLHYYTNLPTIITPPVWSSNFHELTDVHKKFIFKYRFPRLVADHFDIVEICPAENYNSNQNLINYFTKAFEQEFDPASRFKTLAHPEQKYPYIKYEEVGILFFQMTKIDRDRITVEIAPNQIVNEELNSVVQTYKPYLESTLNNYDEWYKEQILLGLNRVKNFLKHIESKGIQVILSTWDYDNVDLIKNDDYLHSKFLSYEYKGKNYDSWMELIPNPKFTDTPENSELLLTHDFDNFLVTPKDIHFSKLGHRVIADNIIKYIEKEGWL